MFDFYPSDGRGAIEEDDEDVDLEMNLQEVVREGIGIIFGRDRPDFLGENDVEEIYITDEDYQPSTSDADTDDEELDSASDSESNKPNESPTKTNSNEAAGEGSSGITAETRDSKKPIDDYNEEEEDDEVIKKIITEIKKPRSKPPSITTNDYVVDLSFHPEQNILAVGNVTGDILIYRYTNEENTLLQSHEVHTKAIRDIEFSQDGKSIFSASRDKSIMITDFETGKLKRFWENAHEEPVYKLSVINENLFATGDDDGTLKLWDLRRKEMDPVFSIKVVEDFISSIITNSQEKLLCCTSGDGYLSTIHIGGKNLHVQSEPYEEEFHCSGLFRNESKLVVGSSKGNFYTYNWGQFGYHCDAFTGTPTPASLMVPITERIAVVAGEEGVIRAMHLVPGRVLGVVGQHSLAVEAMDISSDGELIATSSHDDEICFWNIKFFEDFDDIKYNQKPTKGTANHNLKSSRYENRGDFFTDLA